MTYESYIGDLSEEEAIAYNKRLISGQAEVLRQIAKARRKQEYDVNIAKRRNPRNRAGYKFSFSGSDARAYAYYPDKSGLIKKQLNKAQKDLEEEQASLAEADKALKNNSLNLEAQKAQAKIEANVNSLKDYTASLDVSMGNAMVALESLTTLSVNIHQPAGQVRALGFKGIKGTAGGIRTIAGTMIFTIIEGHPLRDLMLIDDEIGSRGSHRNSWSMDDLISGRGTVVNRDDKYSKVSTMLSPFNLRVNYVSEYMLEEAANGGQVSASSLEVEGIRLISQGIVTSVNDVVTEIQYQFIAEDIKDFASGLYMNTVASSDTSGDPLEGLEGEALLEAANVNYEDLHDAYQQKLELKAFDDMSY